MSELFLIFFFKDNISLQQTLATGYAMLKLPFFPHSSFYVDVNLFILKLRLGMLMCSENPYCINHIWKNGCKKLKQVCLVLAGLTGFIYIIKHSYQKHKLPVIQSDFSKYWIIVQFHMQVI